VVGYHPRCEFLNLERKEIQGSFTKSHSDLKRFTTKRNHQALSVRINEVLKEENQVDTTIAKDFPEQIGSRFNHKVWGCDFLRDIIRDFSIYF
jgi:ferrous iron transport protein B